MEPQQKVVYRAKFKFVFPFRWLLLPLLLLSLCLFGGKLFKLARHSEESA